MLVIAKAALVVGSTLAVAGAYTFHEGVIRVDVDEHRPGGSHVHFWVPATTVGVGLRLAPRRNLHEAALRAQPFLPLIRIIARELRKYPDAELVDVKDSTDHVRITMHKGNLRIDADGKDGTVHLDVPVEVLRDLADRLEDAAHPSTI